jgi:hypothetical protein
MSKGEKGESKAILYVDVYKNETSIDAARTKYFRDLQKDVPELKIASQEKRVVNGVTAYTAQLDGLSLNGAVEFVVQFYAGPEGAVALTGATAPANLKTFQSDFDEMFSGFEKPNNPTLTSAPWLTEWTRKAIRKIDSPVLMRVAAVAALAATWGQTPAVLFHDYGGTILVVGWLFAFWIFVQRWLLRPVLTGELEESVA